MLDFLKKILVTQADEASSTNDEHSILMACLVLLVETAKSDHSLDETELNTILTIAHKHYHLNDRDIEEVVTEAKAHANEATSLYEFTSLINEHFDESQKFRLIKNMWQVAYADGRIDRYEEHIIRRASELLYLDHVRFIEAKLSVKEAL